MAKLTANQTIVIMAYQNWKRVERRSELAYIRYEALFARLPEDQLQAVIEAEDKIDNQ